MPNSIRTIAIPCAFPFGTRMKYPMENAKLVKDCRPYLKKSDKESFFPGSPPQRMPQSDKSQEVKTDRYPPHYASFLFALIRGHTKDICVTQGQSHWTPTQLRCEYLNFLNKTILC